MTSAKACIGSFADFALRAWLYPAIPSYLNNSLLNSEDRFHSSQFFQGDVAMDSVFLCYLAPRGGLALAYGADLARAACVEPAA